MSDTSYHLEAVPQPPTSNLWRDRIRWLVAVMDDDDPDLEFTASLFSYCMGKGGLTERQGKYAGKIFARVVAQFDAGTLSYQSNLHVRKAPRIACAKGKASSR